MFHVKLRKSAVNATTKKRNTSMKGQHHGIIQCCLHSRSGVQELAGLPAEDAEPRGVRCAVQRLRAVLAADGALVAHILALLRADQAAGRNTGLVTQV